MIQNFLEKVLNTLNDGKALQIHDNINDELSKVYFTLFNINK